MTEEKSDVAPRTETIKRKLKDGYTIPILILMIAILIISCSIFYVNTTSGAKPDDNSSSPLQQQEQEIITIPLINNITNKIRVKTQPNCTKVEHIIKMLADISSELYIKSFLCTPDDVNNLKKHNVPSFQEKKVAEPRGHFVIYIAVGLLLASLAAAFVDVYKVKGKTSKSKPQLMKRCSLADLTVLRHSRRESMKKDGMVDDHRVPLKLLGARPTENRRCSVPIQAGDLSYGNVSPRHGSRKCSLDDMYSNDITHNRRLMRRF